MANPIPVGQLTVAQAYQEFTKLVDRISAKFAQLDSGEFGAVGTPAFNNNNNNILFYSVIVVIISHSVCDATRKCRVGRSIRRSLSAYGSSITKYNFHFIV